MLYRDHAVVSVWNTLNPGGRAGGGCADILESLVPTRSTHTSLISLPRSCGGMMSSPCKERPPGLAAWWPHGAPMGPKGAPLGTMGFPYVPPTTVVFPSMG